jgi:peroxiredoxin/uncharacterized GH25 family protein
MQMFIRAARLTLVPILVSFLLLATSAAPVQVGKRPTLRGVILDDEAKPVKGARVFIFTAAPKEGVGVLCPSCYPDCQKQALTDAEGQFKIESLDPTLLFRVLAVFPGHKPEFANKVDPAVNELNLHLQNRLERISPTQQVKGRVMNKEGKPISGAVVSIRGITRGESTRFGGNNDVDQLAVSAEDGTFVIQSEKDFDAAGVDVEARGYAKGVFTRLTTGGAVHELKLLEGGSLRGRLLKDGKPLNGFEIGVSGVEREASIYIGNYSVGTDSNGAFFIPNLPPRHDYWLYPKMKSLGNVGTLAAQRIRVNEDGELTDAGDLKVVRGFTLAGQLKLSNDKPIPFNTRVLLSRDEAWDSTQVEADPDGRFEFEGVPAETISISVRVKGYHFSSRNRSLDLGNPYHLVGVLQEDKKDLTIEFEPGEDRDRNRGDYVDLRKELLEGTEPARQRRGDIHVTGKVMDADTKDPIQSFTITEGREGRFPDRVSWLKTRQTQGTNGHVDLYLNKGSTGLPALMVEVDGYLPASSGLISTTETNITFSLKKGHGATGVILKPNGIPAAAVTVYLTDMRNGVYVADKDMKVREQIYSGTRSAKTDEQGRFSFNPTVDDYSIIVLAEDGFTETKIDALKQHPQVRLEPWAKVKGQLLIGAKPAPGETISLGKAHVPSADHPRQFAALALHLRTTTDADGNFSFDKVPPTPIQIHHVPKVRDGREGTVPMAQEQQFLLEPGEEKKLTLGGKGRPVIGKVLVHGYDQTIDWHSDVFSLQLVLPPNPNVPDFLADAKERSAKLQAAKTEEEKKKVVEEFRQAQEERQAKMRAFYATEAGRNYQFQNRRYALKFSQDGTFRVEDVPGGKYKLHIDLREGSGLNRFSSPLIANVDKELEIPGAPGERSDEPYDVGTIEVQAVNNLRSGKVAPHFEVKTLDDKTIKLSDFKGKYLLLDFWAVWCGPCVAEVPFLKETYAAFKNDPRFAMVGLSLDPEQSAPREYAKKNDLGWIMGFLGEWSKTDLPSKYGVEGIPGTFLIGPDGKILARDLRGPAIKGAVTAALRKADFSKQLLTK